MLSNCPQLAVTSYAALNTPVGVKVAFRFVVPLYKISVVPHVVATELDDAMAAELDAARDELETRTDELGAIADDDELATRLEELDAAREELEGDVVEGPVPHNMFPCKSLT